LGLNQDEIVIAKACSFVVMDEDISIGLKKN